MNEIQIVNKHHKPKDEDLGNVRRKGKLKNLAKVHDKNGYVQHCFSINNRKYNVMAHTLVNEAFNGPRPLNNITRHIDDIPNNNISTNLLWGTNAENSLDMVKRNRQTKGSKSHLSKLNEDQVKQIRTLSLYMSNNDLAKLFNVSASNISNIINNHTWKHLDENRT